MHRIESWTCTLATTLTLAACGDAPTTARRAAPDDSMPPSRAGASAGDPGADRDPTAPPGIAGASDADDEPGSQGGAGGTSSATPPLGVELRIHVHPDAPTFVSLESGSELELEGESEPATWDLKFQGWDVFTNGGASGGGKGAAFGPLPFTYFAAAEDPTDVPFLIEDRAAGAFRDWYFYDAAWHALYSRFHVYGVKSAERLFKVQLLGYYGDVHGAPISGLYRLRYAEVTPNATADTVELVNVDATAGGLDGDDTATSACLTLQSAREEQLTPEQAAASTTWDLQFRRDVVSVNGGSVAAVDLDADASAAETLELIKSRTAEDQAARFAALDHAALTAPSLVYRPDGNVSALTGAWVDVSADPPALAADNTWLIVGAGGMSRYLLSFVGIEGAKREGPDRVIARLLKVR